ncbi:MAG: DUF1800 domain-containing protein, partial [Bacteroidota bacterium]
MDRRNTLAKLLGRQVSDDATMATATAAANFISGLAPYTGTFGYEQAAHLLRRSTFGISNQMVKDAVSQGLDATMSQLFASLPLPSPPLNYNFPDDPLVPIGQTWVDAATTQGVDGLTAYRAQSLRAWTIHQMRSEGISIREKMTLFWHNHYATADINDGRFIYKYITMFRQNAWGNFRELTKQVNIDPSMLRYLNGNENSAIAPNENYARELLELFTIGKGPIMGPGDYTNYTEVDIQQMARVLTGWRDRGYNTSNPVTEIGAIFLPNRHDQGTKQLSNHFGNVTISNMADQEHLHLIDVIFSQDECARFICRKLYRWFVYYVISDQIEMDVIQPMAQILVDNDYEIRPALEALLRSEHFFDILNVGPMIKSPVDFELSVLRNFEVEFPENNINQLYRLEWNIFRTMGAMQMTYFDPPSVAGWKAYYQEPVFYRTWISSATLPPRMDFTTRMITNGFSAAGATAKVNVLAFAASLDDPTEPNNLIEECVRILFPQPITQFQKDFLKGI